MASAKILIKIDEKQFAETKKQLEELTEIVNEINIVLNAHWFTRLTMKIIRLFNRIVK